ncbi:catalase [Paenibacillus cellulosilyticus]|uniref:Catalase n=1 Tax=Paenibacillus cellulosilyticus TaxID=375489 RepID=A0A2V2YLK0_9BACL|nr:catalase [Paenibacillus cellulosilyticus]PWV93765.1 catalase [Paenibacillus cellulosilyticus]QKS48793.1 catalase [Paenibacillus cellulosilyticus]
MTNNDHNNGLGAGSSDDQRFSEGESELTLTNRQGHPVTDNQNLRTVGRRGPTTLENYDFLEKISHFDRERIPERVVHARGAGAHGYFEAYGKVGNEPVAKYTRAKLFQEAGKRTPVFVRFSSVIHGGHSPETLRDPRGFAIKFYTEDGNWDLVGNNLKIFFIRDAIKFPDMVHAFKPDPVTNIQSNERFFDFVSNSPEATHMVTFLFSPWGIPANYRQMQGSGVHAYKWVNADGQAILVKYHWEPLQGVKNLTAGEAEKIQGTNFNHATQDLYEAIERGDYPEWELSVQLMTDNEHPELDYDPLDPTKLWDPEQFPFLKVGKMVLDRNPINYFAEVEQVAFGTGVLVDGLDFSDDKLLQGRTFSYSDTQRHRVGTNYLQLPINAPKKHVATNQRDGQMTYEVDLAPGQNPHVNYEPSSLGGLQEAPQRGKEHEPLYNDRLVRQQIDRTNDFAQAGATYRSLDEVERADLIANLGGALAECKDVIRNRMVEHFTKADPEYGANVAKAIEEALAKRASMHSGITSQNGDAMEAAAELGHPSDGY